LRELEVFGAFGQFGSDLATRPWNHYSVSFMATKNSKARKDKKQRKGVPGRDHELLVKAVYKALLNQDQVKNLEITQNKKIQGSNCQMLWIGGS
jgi:hypothetical protein